MSETIPIKCNPFNCQWFLKYFNKDALLAQIRMDKLIISCPHRRDSNGEHRKDRGVYCIRLKMGKVEVKNRERKRK